MMAVCSVHAVVADIRHRPSPRRSTALARVAPGRVALALAIVALAACKEAGDPPPAASIAGMNPVDSVRLGKTFQFNVEVRDDAGNKLTGRRIDWSSLNSSIATVDENGTVTGLAVGSTLITARSGNATEQTDMQVQPAVANVIVLPTSFNLPVGSARVLDVTLNDNQGKSVGGRRVTFSSSNPSIATVNASGVVSGVSIGRATITANADLDNVLGTTVVDVVPVVVSSVTLFPPGPQTVYEGLTLQLTAELRDNGGNVITGRQITWTTANPSIATVSQTGLVTGVTLGNTQITAESEGRLAVASINVAPRPIVTISLGPNPATVTLGNSVQMVADMRDASGAPLSFIGRTVDWRSSNNPIAIVNGNGVVTAMAVGSAVITVTVDGKPASATVNVVAQ